MTGNKKWRDTLISYIFCAPAYTVFTLFIFVPIIWAFVLSFYDFSILTYLTPDFVGLRNYIRMVNDSYFWEALFNTFHFSAIYVPVSILAGFVFAIMLNERFPGRNFFRLAIFIPVVVSMVVASIVWLMILSPSSAGFANRIVGSFGIDPQGWLTQSNLAMNSIILVMVWKNFGFNMLIYLSGLQSIPDEFYQAAELDGASRFQRIIKITLPLVRPTTFFLLVTTTINAFQIFTPIYLMTGGGPGYSTTTIVNYLYMKGFQEFEMGYASAISVILFGILLLFTLIQKRISKSSDEAIV